MDDTTIGGRIHLAMQRRGLRKPADLARLASSTTATISNWMNGNVVPEHVKASQLFRISDALQVDGRWLLFGQGSAFSRVEEPLAAYESHPVKSDLLRLAIQLVDEELATGKRSLPPDKKAEATQLAYDLLEEGMPKAKVLRFVHATLAA